ncbi:MAG: UTP--glucose-phosphate uridylyltransferase [Candidatus Saccharibacteria bacterium]|nr:UTP--glucose-phosphate uridylyltransferase [Candidatus Saccharibacteria bacterium]
MNPARKPVRKAVIAAAGFGTRFLPQTKAMPKEMLPLIDKPIIQYVVEELVEAGIKDIIIISGSNKRSIEDHFDLPNQDLVANLVAGGPKKAPLLDAIDNIANLANFVYVRQKGPYGNATPIMNAEHLVGDEPFIYTFADDFFASSPGRTRQLIDAYNEYEGSVFACKTAVSDDEYDRYGFVHGEHVSDGVLKADRIIEKPGKANSPSDMASVSGYLLTPDVFRYIEKAIPGLEDGKEFQIQPIMQKMMDDGLPFYAKQITGGTYHDTGDKLEYLKTVVHFALEREEIRDDFREYLKKVVS